MGGGKMVGTLARVVAKVLFCGALGAALLLGEGCARSSPPHRSDALARSRALLDKVSAIEADLHAQNSEIVLYGELGARRQEISEVTCSVAASHVREISRLAEAQTKKRREKARKLALLRHDKPRNRSQQ